MFDVDSIYLLNIFVVSVPKNYGFEMCTRVNGRFMSKFEREKTGTVTPSSPEIPGFETATASRNFHIADFTPTMLEDDFFCILPFLEKNMSFV